MEILSKSVLSNEYRSVKNVNVLMWRKKNHGSILHYFVQIKGN